MDDRTPAEKAVQKQQDGNLFRSYNYVGTKETVMTGDGSLSSPASPQPLFNDPFGYARHTDKLPHRGAFFMRFYNRLFLLFRR